MSNFKIDSIVTKALINFVANYTNEIPTEEQVSNFLIQKINEREIQFSLSQGLITKKEAVDFIVGHVFTEYAKGISINLEGNAELERLNNLVLDLVVSN